MSKDKSVADTLVIKDALFPHSHAQALWSALQQQAPNLCAWLNSSHGTVRTHDPLVDRCTALEHLLISQSGFKPDRHQAMEIGRASCRERGENEVGDVTREDNCRQITR